MKPSRERTCAFGSASPRSSTACAASQGAAAKTRSNRENTFLNYKLFRKLIDEWVELSVQYGRARLDPILCFSQ